jgi:hypothetical protein
MTKQHVAASILIFIATAVVLFFVIGAFILPGIAWALLIILAASPWPHSSSGVSAP